jgi:hypothetical protein
MPRIRRFVVTVEEVEADEVVSQEPPPVQTRDGGDKRGWFARQWRGPGKDPGAIVEWTPEQQPEDQ